MDIISRTVLKKEDLKILIEKIEKYNSFLCQKSFLGRNGLSRLNASMTIALILPFYSGVGSVEGVHKDFNKIKFDKG